jgi:hypothetical protein
MVVKWSGLTGTIARPNCTGALSLEVSGEPYWFVKIGNPGTQISKIFEAGKLEQAYNWCVETIQDHERQHKERGNS